MGWMEQIANAKQNKPPRIVLHGPEKVGKSTFAAGAPNPIFLQVEDGLSGIETNAFPKVETFDQFIEQCNELYNSPHDFQTVVVDSADWLELVIYDKICKDSNSDSIEKALGGYSRGQKRGVEIMRTVLKAMDGLNKYRGMNVIIICHSRVVTVNDPLHESYDQFQMKLYSPRNGYGSSDLLKEWCDILLFVDMKKNIRGKQEGVNVRPGEGRGTTSGVRKMYTQPHPAYSAGSRYPLPAELELSWPSLSEALAANKS